MKNIERLREIYSEAFPNESKAYIANFIDRTDESHILTYEQSGEIVSVAYVVDKFAKVGERTVVMPYLSAIATKNEYRGKGLVKYPLSDALEYLYKRGDMFVALYPFDHKYYTRFDFSTVSFGTKSVISGGRDYAVRVATIDDAESMINIAKKTCKGKNFHQLFNSKSIESLLGDYTVDNGNIYIVSDRNNKSNSNRNNICDSNSNNIDNNSNNKPNNNNNHNRNNMDGDFAFFGVSGDEIDLVVSYDYDKFDLINLHKGQEYMRFVGGNQPLIQARIVNARKVLDEFCHILRPHMVYRVTDKMIKQNNFCFYVTDGKVIPYEYAPGWENRGYVCPEIPINILCEMVWQVEKGRAENVFFDKY